MPNIMPTITSPVAPAFQIDQIAQLATDIACHGAIAASQVFSDQVFEATVSVAALIYEMYPG
jgi:hypothetical protein